MTSRANKTHLIKRYQNRKLYDTLSSCYVTLEDIGQMIREGEDVRIIDNKNREDLTSITLSQIIFEQEKKKKSLLPIETLRKIVQSGGERIGGIVNNAGDLVQGAIENSLNSINTAKGEAEKYIDRLIKKGDQSVGGGKQAIKEFIDEHFKSAFESISLLPSLHSEIRTLQKKIDHLETKLRKYEH